MYENSYHSDTLFLPSQLYIYTWMTRHCLCMFLRSDKASFRTRHNLLGKILKKHIKAQKTRIVFIKYIHNSKTTFASLHAVPSLQFSPCHPSTHAQVYDPWLLMHVPLCSHGLFSHSSTSKKKKDILLNFSSFYRDFLIWNKKYIN